MKRSKRWQASHLVTHADDLNAWLYNVNVGSINKTRYQIKPYDTEIIMIFLQGKSKAIHQRGIRNLSYTGQQISDQSTCQLIQPKAKAFKSSELYDYKKQPHRSAHPHVQGSGHRWQLQQPVWHPLPWTFTGASVRCNTTTTYTGLCSSSNETAMASMWDRTPHMPHHTFGKWSPSSHGSINECRCGQALLNTGS